MSIFHPPEVSTVTGRVADARSAVAGEQYLSASRCVDLLLDCLNASVRPSVRTVIAERLALVAPVNLVTGAAFATMLDEIHLALQVDAAFDDLELGA